MVTNRDPAQTSTMPGHSNGAPWGVPFPSERDLRARRREMGIPVATTHEDIPPQDLERAPKRKKQLADSDDEFEEFTNSSENYSTSESDEDHASAHHRVASGSGDGRDIILLQDSRFSSDRTRMRHWHELRYVRSLWSREEEDELVRDYAGITDGDDVRSASNAVLWTASFDRYGVPPSDIFTYGIRPHPSCLRGARKRLLGPQFCDHLAAVMVHPIFEGDAALLRYTLQAVVRMRVGMHVPPMGTMPGMEDSDFDQVSVLAETLLLEEDTPEERTLMHADAYLIVSQGRGARAHPDIAMLEDLLAAHFASSGCANTAPRDDAPYARCLFYVQLWDLQFLLGVLDGLPLRAPYRYLSVGKYKAMWINDTHRIQGHFADKLDDLVQQWFLSDERNYRIRQALRRENPQKRLYDIPEEDFNPTYARSQFVTDKMRAVLEGTYLEALRHPCAVENTSPQNPAASSPDPAHHLGSQSPACASGVSDATADAAASDVGGKEEQGNSPRVVEHPVSAVGAPQNTPMTGTEEKPTTATPGPGLGDQRMTSPVSEVRSDAETDVGEHTDGENCNGDRAYDGDPEETEVEEDQMRPRSRASFVSVQSVASSRSEDDEGGSPYRHSHWHFPRRGPPPSDHE